MYKVRFFSLALKHLISECFLKILVNGPNSLFKNTLFGYLQKMLNYLLPSAWILDEVKDSHLKILKETERISKAKKNNKKYQL